MRFLTFLAVWVVGAVSFAADRYSAHEQLPVLVPGYYVGQEYGSMAKCYIKIEKEEGLWAKINSSAAIWAVYPMNEEKLYRGMSDSRELQYATVNIQVDQDGSVTSFSLLGHPKKKDTLCLISR